MVEPFVGFGVALGCGVVFAFGFAARMRRGFCSGLQRFLGDRLVCSISRRWRAMVQDDPAGIVERIEG